MKRNIVVLGAGGWAIALAMALFDNGNDVTIWSKIPSELDEIRSLRQRPSVLDGVTIPAGIAVNDDLSVVKNADAVVLATAARFVRPTAASLRGLLSAQATVISVAKGLDPDTKETLSDVIAHELPHNPITVLSGPSHAEEVARKIPTTLVSASVSKETAGFVAELFINSYIRIYLSDDVTGVQLGGVIKNVIAVAAGIIDGMGYGDNTRAALMTRAIVEMARLGEAMGGRKQTFAGLTGVGDLIVTCTSMHSRNHRCGILIGKGVDTETAVKEIGMTVEGVASAKTVHELAAEKNVEMPIVDAVYAILYEGLSVREAMKTLMKRSVKSEDEDVWF